MRKKPFFIVERIFGLLIPCIFILLSDTGLFQRLEWQAHTVGIQLSPQREPSADIVIVGIDDASMELLGDQPWSAQPFATLTQQLARAQAATIAYTLPLDLSRSPSQVELMSRAFSGNRTPVVLGLPYTPLTRNFADANLPVELTDQVVLREQNQQHEFLKYLPFHQPAKIRRITATSLELVSAVKKTGVTTEYNDEDQPLSPIPLALRYDQYVLPAFELAAAFPNERLKINAMNSVVAGGNIIETDDLWKAFPFFYSGDKGTSIFKVVPLVEILYGSANQALFKGKTVLVGITSPRETSYIKLPSGEQVPPVVLSAHLVSNLKNNDLYKEVYATDWSPYIVYLVLAIYLFFMLPRLNLGTGLAFTLALVVVALNLQLILMITSHIRLPMATPVIALLVGHVIIATFARVRYHFDSYKQQFSKAQHALGQAYQAQGNFDGAFDAYQKCEPDDALLSSLYNLGLDYERRRLFNKAIKVFSLIRGYDKDYKDVQTHIKQNSELSQAITVGQKTGKTSSGTLLIAASGTEKPVLGRYEIQKEIGKGAMGTVYLGRDPKIGRTVAIKTMSISGNDPDMDDIKKRFFREAETAGRLTHKNIVAIHDVGEEHDLAYIAMDFLPGKPLSEFVKPADLLPHKEVVSIAIQVAGALHYAHEERVVHRDIKPANIIYDPKTKICKITDFGIAHITDRSNTATGTILGSPNYMSPEQLVGRKVDGRSDLFSLGVTAYQLLSGELPFSGDTLSSLMYNIANKKHQDIRKIVEDLPDCVAIALNRCLQKTADKRFSNGGQLELVLRKCLSSSF